MSSPELSEPTRPTEGRKLPVELSRPTEGAGLIQWVERASAQNVYRVRVGRDVP